MKFFKSSLVHALGLFFFTALVNQLVIMRTYELEISRQVFAALLTGLTATVFFPVLIALVISFFLEKLENRGRAAAFLLLLFSIFPIVDLIYFKSTFSRFSWSVLHDLNFYSIKASLLEVIFNSSNLPALGLLLALIVTAGLTLKFGRASPEISRTLLIQVLFVLVICRFFCPPEYYPHLTIFTPFAMKTEGKNNLLRQLEKGSLRGFFMYKSVTELKYEFVDYTTEEISTLRALGVMLPAESTNSNPFKQSFSKVIVVVFESLALEYLHTFNPLIPKEASSFFDELHNSFPAAKNYFTSDSPTMNGLYAMLNSRIPFNSELAKKRKERGFAALFKEKTGGQTIFIRGVSKFYGNENLLLKTIMGFDKVLAYEDLKMHANEPPFSDWGFHDDTVLERAFSAIKENRDRSFFIMCKLIDLHQPPFYCGLPSDKLPKTILEHKNPIVRSIYWANHLLKNFVDQLDKNGLLDRNTLLVITADHYPPPGYGHMELVKHVDYDSRGRLPLIFISKRPEIFKNFCPQAFSCQLDFAPTICHLSGISASKFFLGQNLVDSFLPDRAISYLDDQIRIIASDSRTSFIQIKNRGTPASALEKWATNLQAIR